jgi:hypothetical protein
MYARSLSLSLSLSLYRMQAYAALLKEMSAAHIIINTVRRLLTNGGGGDGGSSGGAPDLQRQGSGGADTMFRAGVS